MMLDPKSTFTPPLLDGSLDLLQIIEHNVKVNTAHPLFRYASSNGAIETITWGSAAKAFDVAARFVLDSAAFDVGVDSRAPPVVAILANLDSITYYTLVVGIMKAGFTAFPISTRNSADGVAHLLAKTNSRLLLTSNDTVIARLAEASCSLFKADNAGARIASVVVPAFDIFYHAAPHAGDAIPARVILDASATPCVILHSSGTVSFPKPISLTYQMFIEQANEIGLKGDLCGHIISTHGVPMFHLMGLKFIAYTALQGVILAVFRPSTPPVIPTPESVLNAAVATASSRILCVPSFLEGWAKQKSSVDALKKFTAIMFGGGPIQSSVGDYLANEGVTLISMLGMTEVGLITTFFPKHIDTEGWEWLALDPNLDFKFLHEDGAEDIYRIIVKQNAMKTLAVVNLTVDGVPAYDTGDLFIRHPTNPQLWKLYGRADEQIMHSSGEKTNPVPIEAGLVSSPYISGAIMFGRARFQAGVLIAPSPDFKFDATNVEETKNYINLIWDTVEEVNRHAPQHSRIFKEMILIASPEKQFEYTPKGSLRREITLKKYVKEIERLYEATESEAAINASPADNSRGDVPKLEDFLTQIQTAVHTILGDAVGDDDDLFRAGADSLCAVAIRNAIIKGLRTRQALRPRSIDALPADLLYYLPSISKISIFLYGASCIDARNSENGSEGVGGEAEVANTVSDEEWQKAMESEETVVEIVKGNNVEESPLIILHGANGTVGPFKNMLQSPTKIWAVQLSDDAPVDTLEALAAFYYQKIKEKQPHGPYRLASYSGSCVIVLELILIFESNGDAISQFIMLDHFPALFLCRLDLDAVELTSPEWWGELMKITMEGILNLFKTTKSIMAAQSTVRIQELRDAMAGKPGISPMTAKVIARSDKLMKVTMEFLLGERFSEEVTEGPNAGRRRFSPEIFKAYTSRIKSQLTVYFADEGIRTIIPPEQWDEFGPRAYFSDAKVVELEGGHIDYLGNEELLNMLKMN